MKKRIIPSILLKSGSTNACLSQRFSPWRTVGTLTQQLKLHVTRGCDELLIINPCPTSNSAYPVSSRMAKLVISNSDIPVGYSGGIAEVKTASRCINHCFDKIFITSSFLENVDLLSEIVAVIGTQSVGVCLPYVCDASTGERFVWDFKRRDLLRNYPLSHYIQKASKEGAGEILVYSVDRDGSMSGFDQDILPMLDTLNLSTPLLLGGGAGRREDFVQVLRSDLIQGVVAGSIFALTEETPRTLRNFCLEAGIPMRRA